MISLLQAPNPNHPAKPHADHKHEKPC